MAGTADVVRLRDVDRLPWDDIALKIGRDERTARRWYRKAKLKTQPSAADPVLAAIERMVGRGGQGQG
jgi:DNA-directed RNA polymerase specialized sigma24 family protein